MSDAYWAKYESVIDRQIRMGQERGDFDDLPGKGKPLPGLDGPDDENWWVKRYIQREGLPTDALLPVPLQLRKEAERLRETARTLPTEQAVRAAAAELNTRIVAWLRAPSGPAIPLRPVNADELVRGWREAKRASAPTASAPVVAAPDRPSWWRRLLRRS